MTAKQDTRQLTKINVDLVSMAKDISYISNDVKDIKEKLEVNYATKDWCESRYGEPTKQFKAVVSLILSAVVVAVVSLVVKK